MADEKHINLSKQTLVQLQELLQRQKALLQNRKLLEHLNDKGESVRQLHDKIKNELDHRKDIDSIESSLSTLSINPIEKDAKFLTETHVQYVCSKDKSIQDTRYRPHRTLIHKHSPSKEQTPKGFVEITAACEPKLRHEPTKFIPLPESLVIQNEQALKVMEEQAKRCLGILQDSTDDECSDTERHDVENEPLDDSN